VTFEAALTFEAGVLVNPSSSLFSFAAVASFFRAGAAPSILAALTGDTFEAALTFEVGVLVFLEGIEVGGVEKIGGKKEEKFKAKL
jgi:hypothetical protein